VTADEATLTACLDASRWATVKAGSNPGPALRVQAAIEV
jgi:hypothetical protein